MAVLNYHNGDSLSFTTGTEGVNQFKTGPQTASGYETDHIRLDSSNPVIGSNCLRFEIVKGLYRDTYPLCRSEVYTRIHGGADGEVMEGWYSFSFRAGTLDTGTENAVISQLHKGSGGSNTPCLSFQWNFSNNQIFFRRYNPDGPNDDFNLFTASTEWNQVDMWYLSRLDNTGRVKIWVNSVLVVDYTGPTDIPGGEYDNEKPYWKLGIYAWSFGESDLSNRVAYFDAISYHDNTSSEAETLAWINNFRNPDPDPGPYNGPWHISNSGNDNNNGSEDFPFATFEKALSVVQQGDTIKFECNGTYPPISISGLNGIASGRYYVTNYGTGENPVISGFVTPTWTNQGNNIWTFQDSGFSTVNILKLGNGLRHKGRLPKEGYNTITGRTGNTQITDTVNISSLPDVVGGELVAKKNKWVMDTQTITAQTTTTLTTSTASGYNYTVGYGYFVQNHANCLTENGDWYYNSSTKTVHLYHTTDPNTLDIQIGKSENCLYQNNSSYWEFFGVDFEGSTKEAVILRSSHNVKFTRCSFNYHGFNGVQTWLSRYATLEYCHFNDIQNIAVNNRDTGTGLPSSDMVIQNCYLNGISMIPGASGNGDGQACGIKIGETEHNVTIRNNRLHNLGYIGVYGVGNNCLVEGNYAENGCLVKSDGALFYTFGAFTGIVFRRNIGINCWGNVEGTNHSGSFGTGDSAIIYTDDNASNVLIEDNVAVNGFMGIYAHNNQSIIYRNNILRNNHIQFRIADDSLGDAVSNLNIHDNTLIAGSGQLVFELRASKGSLQYGTINNNKLRSVDTSAYRIRREAPLSNPGTTLENLSQWRTRGYDIDSTLSDYDEENELILVNDSGGIEVYELDGVYNDLSGTDHVGSIELDENESIYLYNTGENPTEEYDLEVRENPMEWGIAVDLTNESPYPAGTEVELQATPETWTQFYRWSRDGVTLSTNQNYLYTTRGQNDLVLGEFQPKQYPLVVTVAPISGGTVNISSGNYTEGQQVPLVATNNTGYTFLNWQRNGEILSTNPSYTHTKTAGNETISAHFVLAKHALTVTAGTGGTATGGGSFAQGETTSLAATVAGGYQFDGWYRDNVKLSSANPYTYTARNQADTVQARFLRKSVAVISADPESGTKPLTVQFSSSGSVADTYAWDFGNGSTSFLALPYTIYQNAGTYTVTLTTTYGELTDTDTVQITVTDPVYVPPTIKITSPQNLSANFEAPAKLPFRVLANSELGITKVEYWVDGVLVATVTNAPYSYDWNNVSEGTYSIVAKAFDAEGSTESDPVSVTVYPPSEKYKLNGKELSDFGIIAGRAPNSNISVSGHLDFPKRMGKSFHVWDDEEGVEPYVSYDEIKFEGRDIKFHGYVEGTDKNDVMSKLYSFYDFLNNLNDEVLFSSKWGSWLVIVQSEVEATQIKAGMVSIVVTFRQTDTGIQSIQSGDESDKGIDGINFGDLGFTYMNLKNQWYRPTTKDHHAIGYFTEPFQVTKAGAREMILSGLLETETYQEMVSIVSSLYSLFAKEGVRTLQINNEPFREFFVKDGFQVTNIIIKHGKCMALLSINMMELNKPVFDPDFFTDTDGNYILSNTNQKIIIRK